MRAKLTITLQKILFHHEIFKRSQQYLEFSGTSPHPFTGFYLVFHTNNLRHMTFRFTKKGNATNYAAPALCDTTRTKGILRNEKRTSVLGTEFCLK